MVATRDATRERERERKRDGHENIYIECASGVLLLQPTRPLFADCPSFACSICSPPLPSYSSSSSFSVPPCVALRPFIPPTNDASHPQTHQLTLFQSYRTSLPCAPSPSLPSSCPGRVSRFTDLASRSKTRGWYRAAESPVVTYAGLSLSSSPSIHHFPFPFLSLSLYPSTSFSFRNEKLRRYKHHRRRRRRRRRSKPA